MRALAYRVFRRVREASADAREALLGAVGRYRAARPARGKGDPFATCANPLISILVDRARDGERALRLTIESALREARHPCEAIDARHEATARGAYRVRVTAGAAFTPGWDGRILELFALHRKAARIAFRLVERNGRVLDGMRDGEVRPLSWDGGPCVAERCDAQGATLYDPRSICVIPAALGHRYRAEARKIALAFDTIVPMEDRDAGGRRMAQIVRMLIEAGYEVRLFAQHRGSRSARRRLEDGGVRICRSLEELVDGARTPQLAWIARPELARRYMPVARAAGARIIYDTVDLHYLRLQREELICGAPTHWARMRAEELALARASDITIVTSGAERRLLAAEGIEAALLSIVEPVWPTVAPFEAREGFLFVGNFTHAPNRDACRYLVESIFPYLRARLPGAHVTLVGFDPERWSHRYSAPGIRVLGHVAALEPLLQRARVSVAPLRFGAGVKGKIVQSFAHGLPVVTTPIGIEGIDLVDARGARSCGAPEEFADAAVRLHEDREHWRCASRAAYACAQPFSPQSARERLSVILRRFDDPTHA